MVADAAGEHRTQPQGFQGADGVLRRQGRVDGAEQEGLGVVERLAPRIAVRRELGQPVEIDQPDQEQGRLDDMFLPPREFGQPRLALGVGDGDDAPGLQVGGRGRRLGGGDGGLQRALRDCVGQKGPHRAVGEQRLQHRVGRDREIGVVAVAGVEQRAQGFLPLIGFSKGLGHAPAPSAVDGEGVRHGLGGTDFSPSSL